MGFLDGLFGLGSAAIESSTNLGIAAMNNKSQEDIARNQREFDMQLYERQRADALEDRDFNSIGSLVEQYKAAGLNPDALAGTAPQSSALGGVAPPYGSDATPDWMKTLSPLVGLAGDLVNGAATAIKTGIDAKNSKVDRYIKELGIPRSRFNSAMAKAEEEVFNRHEDKYKELIFSNLANQIQSSENEHIKLLGESLQNLFDLRAGESFMNYDEDNKPYLNEEGEALVNNRANAMFRADTRDQNSFDTAIRHNRLSRMQADNAFEDWQRRTEQAFAPVSQAIAEGQLSQIEAANAANDLINGLDVSPETKGVLLLLVNKVIPFGAELGADFLGKKWSVAGQMKVKSSPTYSDLH